MTSKIVSQPQHHPSVPTLAAYAAGSLRPGFDLVVTAHVHSCVSCARRMRAYEREHGATLSGLPGTPLTENALAHALARLDRKETGADEGTRTLDDLLASAPRRWVAPGVWVAKIDTPHAAEDRVYMLSAAPGVATARHGHSGAEFTQVLSGVLRDGEIVYRGGDFSECIEADTHHPKTEGDAPCICLFATSGRLRAKGILGRMAFALADV